MPYRNRRYLCFIVLILSLSLLTAFRSPAISLEQSFEQYNVPMLQEAEGRELTNADWSSYLPLVAVVIVVVIVVNAVFLAQIPRFRRRQQEEK